jgi:hypothetical protein
MKKRALCIGINYTGTPFALRGCLNDAVDWSALLQDQGYRTTLLLESDATRQNILNALSTFIASLNSGDCGVLTYSGHGTWVPDLDGDEPDGCDEALCPIDMSTDAARLILDDELHGLFNGIRPGARIIFVADCCHSGTVFRFAGGRPNFLPTVRFIPPSHFHLSEDRHAHMLRAYGQSHASNAPLPGLIHFAACKDREYACDACFGGRPNGAFTFYALMAFAGAAQVNGTVLGTWRQIRTHLPSTEFPQTPLLSVVPTLKGALTLP